MRKKLMRAGSLLLVFIIILTSLVTAISTKAQVPTYTLTIDPIVNPYIGETDRSSLPTSASSLRLNSYDANATDFDTNLCINDDDIIAQDIRETMVERKASLNIYYKSNVELDDNSLQTLFGRWVETALAETENPDEGDYLRWVYKIIDVHTINGITDGINYYYHIPLSFEYYTTRAQEDELDEKIEEVIQGFNFDASATSRQKFDAIYAYITDNVVYDYDNLDNDDYYLKHTAYAALINGTAVCQGYATLYYRLARECGLETRVITGKSRDENHA